MELAALQLCAWIKGVTGVISRRGCQAFSFHKQPQTGYQLTTTSPPMAALAHLPAPPPSSTAHRSPLSLPPASKTSRKPAQLQDGSWAVVLFPSLKQFASVARKWRLSMLPKTWKGICLKGLFLTFNFASVTFHFSSAVLILAYPQIKRDQN